MPRITGAAWLVLFAALPVLCWSWHPWLNGADPYTIVVFAGGFAHSLLFTLGWATYPLLVIMCVAFAIAIVTGHRKQARLAFASHAVFLAAPLSTLVHPVVMLLPSLAVLGGIERLSRDCPEQSRSSIGVLLCTTLLVVVGLGASYKLPGEGGLSFVPYDTGCWSDVHIASESLAGLAMYGIVSSFAAARYSRRAPRFGAGTIWLLMAASAGAASHAWIAVWATICPVI